MWGAVLGAVGRGAVTVGRTAARTTRFLGEATIARMRSGYVAPDARFNTNNWGVRGYLNNKFGGPSSPESSSGMDFGAYALSQLLNREFQKISGAESALPLDVNARLDNVPDVTGENIPYVIRVLERNVYLVDKKVQAVGRNVKKTDQLLEYAKKTLDRTNSLLETNARAASAQRFKDLENKMEAAQSIAAIDQKVQEEVAARVAEAEERLRAEMANQGGGLLEGILGLFGKGVKGPGAARSAAGGLGLLKGVTAAAAIAAPTAALASLPQNASVEDLYKQADQESSLSRFMNSGEQNDADYGKLMKRIDDSKTDRATIVSTDLYNLAARAAFFSADTMSFSSKRNLDLNSDGTVTLFSKQEIVLNAPIIRLNGRVIGNQMVSPESSDNENGGDVTPSTPDDNRPGWVPPAKNKPSTPEGVSPLNGDETINTTEGGDRVSEAFRYFKSKGWSDEQAAAIVGNYQGESGQGIDFTNNTGDGGAAFGAAQWNRNGSPDRYDNFKKLYGKDLTEATWEEQMEFTNWELTSDDPNNRMQKKAGDLLRKATTSSEGALIVSQYYERPNAAYANNQGRIDNADAIMKKKDKYLAEDQNNPILTKNKKTDEATFKGDAPEGYHTGMAPIKMTNDGATRHYDIDPALKQKLQESVYTTYGPGYSVEVYSGGQDAAGRKKLGSSSRHNIDKDGEGQAADVYVIDPNGNRVVGDDLGKLGQYWQAKDYGGTGLEMHGGGIHLDGHTDRARTWNYGNETKGARQAVAEGVKGQLPDDLHYVQDEKPGWTDDPKTTGVEPKAWGNENSTTIDKPITQADVDAMYGGIYDSPVAAANTMGDVIASNVVMPEDLPPKTVATTPAMPSGPKGRKRKNTHDGVNMSSSDLLASTDEID